VNRDLESEWYADQPAEPATAMNLTSAIRTLTKDACNKKQLRIAPQNPKTPLKTIPNFYEEINLGFDLKNISSKILFSFSKTSDPYKLTIYFRNL